MPEDAPKVKINATRGYGGEVILYDRFKEDWEDVARRLQAERGLTLIHPFANYDVISGAGTVTKELIEEVGELDHLFVCIGGGGLIAGSSIAAKELSPNCQIHGVEPLAGNDA